MADLTIGVHLDNPEAEATLIAKRFNRHTFWCGQSGSGKTYALGVVLEQIMLRTSLPMVIFDPNGDFTRMGEIVSQSPDADELRTRTIRVLSPGGDDPLRVRFADLPIPVKAALLRIDPIIDREEYNAMLHAPSSFDLQGPRGIIALLNESAEPIHHALALRVENLGLTDWGLWAFDKQAATEVVAERPDATVLNLGGCEHEDEPLIIALSVLENLWARRAERRPVLLVIDEAHNLCAPDLESPLARAVRDQIIRIAAEGRKFGLWLLLSTQRPSKIHPNILSQCDNLALMKMSSPLDLEELAKVFGFAPEDLLLQSPYFQQGQGLFAGGFTDTATIVQMGERLTAEGGSDVAVPTRAPRP
jgi:DNA helicase HerA-like ATPase